MKMLDGTYRRDRARDEPVPEQARQNASPPKWLPRSGIPWQTWFRLFPMLARIRVMTEADKDALALGCVALDDYLKLREDPSASWQRADAAWKRYWRMLEGFGMTPASRTKITVIPVEKSDPVERWQKAI